MSRLSKIFGVKEDTKIYGNFEVLSPEGILMFRCDLKKINWYLNRDLAEKIDDKTIRLKFKPNGLGNHNKPFGLSLMENKCVVCGDDKFLTRHHVVPISYRKYFPLEIKSHNFHDVLSMCVSCHDSYERKADILKQKLSDDYDAPLNGLVEKDELLLRLYKLSSVLLSGDKNIPNYRIKEVKTEIKSLLNISRLTRKKLIEISNFKSTKVSKTHGEMVISKVDDIQKFVEMWREHFITNNDCKHLPENWNIKNQIWITRI